MLPAASPATHSDADGQDTVVSGRGIGLVVSRQAANPLESSAKESSPRRSDARPGLSGTLGQVGGLAAAEVVQRLVLDDDLGGLPCSASTAAKRPASLTAITASK